MLIWGFCTSNFDAKKTNLNDIFDINDLEKLQPRRQLPPRYPAKAKANGIEGFVLAEFIVDQNGDVESVVVKDSSHSFFEPPTVDAICNGFLHLAKKMVEKEPAFALKYHTHYNDLNAHLPKNNNIMKQILIASSVH